MTDMTLRYVALGDSYTIGISVASDEAWPNRLVAGLGQAGDGNPRLKLTANLATNGQTSGDVLGDQLPRLDRLEPEFVTVQIGVNDVVQGRSTEAYRRDVTAILDHLAARLPVNRLLTVTTPDYTVTPAGGRFGDPTTQRARIREVNSIMSELAAKVGVATVDIFDLSSRAGDDRSLVALDGLHPSARQYDLWIERIRPVVARLLEAG